MTQSSGNPVPGSPAPEKPNTLLLILAVVLLVFNSFISVGQNYSGGGLPELMGAALAPTIFILIVYGIARAMGKGKTMAAQTRIAFWTMLVVVVVNLANASRRAGEASPQVGSRSFTPPPQATIPVVAVTDGERAALEITASQIRHTAFRFSMPSPGPGFERDLATQRRVDSANAAQRAMVSWVFASHSRREALAIQAVKIPFALDEAGFRVYAASIRQGMTRASPGITILLDTLVWRAPDSEFRLEMQSQGKRFVQYRCLPQVRTGGSLVVCVMTSADRRADLESVRRGLAFY